MFNNWITPFHVACRLQTFHVLFVFHYHSLLSKCTSKLQLWDTVAHTAVMLFWIMSHTACKFGNSFVGNNDINGVLSWFNGLNALTGIAKLPNKIGARPSFLSLFMPMHISKSFFFSSRLHDSTWSCWVDFTFWRPPWKWRKPSSNLMKFEEENCLFEEFTLTILSVSCFVR